MTNNIVEPVKINSLELENVKRIKAVQLEPTKDGLTVIGGRNGQGKTSVLDAIAWALGGNSKKPTNPQRDGSVLPPELHITLTNGLIVERKGKNGSLKVTDPQGKKGGQKLLDEFISNLALDLPKFMQANDKDKALTLLKTLGIEDKLQRIDNELEKMAEDRLIAGREARAKEAHAAELPEWKDLPAEELSVDDLVQQQQDIMARNAQNQRVRDQAANLAVQAANKKQAVEDLQRTAESLKQQLAQLNGQIEEANTEYSKIALAKTEAEQKASQLVDESTDSIVEELQKIEETNARIRDNIQKHRAAAIAEKAREEYQALSDAIEGIRARRLRLLEGAKLPLSELSITEEGALVYKGQTWDGMSGAEQLKVAAAIVRATKPECGFVLLDKLEQMDPQSLEEFGQWAKNEGLQIIGTRVATDDTCTIVIEDGYVQGQKNTAPEADQEPAQEPEEAPAPQTWGGTF